VKKALWETAFAKLVVVEGNRDGSKARHLASLEK
jgi:hypothetical protein